MSNQERAANTNLQKWLRENAPSPPAEIVKFTVARRPDPFPYYTDDEDEIIAALQRASIAETSEETFIPPVQKEYEMQCHAVELAIISLIEAQSEVAYCESYDRSLSYCFNRGSELSNDMAWARAIDQRHAALKQLIDAIARSTPFENQHAAVKELIDGIARTTPVVEQLIDAIARIENQPGE
jgi:hypothetical protein